MSLIRLTTIPTEKILPLLLTYQQYQDLKKLYRFNKLPISQLRKNISIQIKGQSVSLISMRYIVFKEKGTTCVNCGRVGNMFAVERNSRSKKYHLNLYSCENNKEILMTQDHIIPKSKNGQTALSNLQPMCVYCNQEKADKINNW